MARDFEEYLRAALQGGLQGASAGMASGRKMDEAFMLEKIKGAMRQQAIGSINLPSGARYSGYKMGEYGLEPTIEIPTKEQELKDIEAQDILNLRQGKKMPTIPNISPTTTQPEEGQVDLIPSEFDKYGRPTKFERSDKPISAEAQQKYSGALKGMQVIKDISDFIGLKKRRDKFVTNKNAPNLIKIANLALEAETKSGALGGTADIIHPAYKAAKLARIKTFGGADTQTGLKLQNAFMQLSESILRAETGAAATSPEMVRTYARNLLKSYIEDPETWYYKLNNSLQFLHSTAKSLRPNIYRKELRFDPDTIFNEPSPLLKPPTQNIDNILSTAGFSPQEIEAYKRGQ